MATAIGRAWSTDMLGELIQGIGQETRPVKIQRYRKKYTDYRTKAETDGDEVMSFEAWLNDQGIDPQKLLGQ